MAAKRNDRRSRASLRVSAFVVTTTSMVISLLLWSRRKQVVDVQEPVRKSSAEFFSERDWYNVWKGSLPRSRWYEYSPYFEPTTRYIHCSIPKNGCSQQKGLLKRIRGDSDYRSMKEIHRHPNVDGLLRVARMKDSEAMEILTSASIPKYMIPRNPVLRILSAYIDKIERRKPPTVERCVAFDKWARQQFTGRDPPYESCEQFYGLDQHWQPQVCFCGLLHTPDLYLQFKFENPAPMVEFIYRTVPQQYLETGWGRNGTASFRESFGKSQKTTHFHGTDSKFLKYIALPTFDFLVEKFQPDIDLFDYRLEIAEMREQIARTGIASLS